MLLGRIIRISTPIKEILHLSSITTKEKNVQVKSALAGY